MGEDAAHGVRYVVDVGPGDSGVRVSLRHRLPEGGFSDVLGVLLSWTDEVTVERRDGSRVTVPATAVVAAKRVPPPPERRR